jgi:hypothetical protein
MLRTQDGASFAATSRQDSAPTTCRHAHAKPMGLAALTSVRLVGPLHSFLRSGARVGAEPDDCIQAIMQVSNESVARNRFTTSKRRPIRRRCRWSVSA